ncbi:MAG: hypothetical protein GEU93_03840 [Propionibacteriales bacterium]|nr:hypothetical protein [Propionibacteriales bacterium]
MSRWTRPPLAVGAALLGALVLRSPFLGTTLESDEAGFLLVARQWTVGGPHLYGDLWVDRPPLLIVIFRIASWLGDDVAVRVVGSLAVAGLVVAAGRSGWLVGGRRGAWWSALTAAALGATPALGTHDSNSELLAVPFVMLCVALTLKSVGSRTPWGRGGLAFAAGFAGSCALLVKQSFVDGLLFGGVLLVALAATRAWSWGRAVRILGVGAAGSLVPAAAAVVWSVVYGPGAKVLWLTMYDFRLQATDVIAEQHSEAPIRRLGVLLLLAVVSGVVLLGWAFLRARYRQIRRGDPVAIATLAMLGVGVLGIALGASYWHRYLIQLIPGLALAAGLVAAQPDRAGVWMRRAIVVTAGSACVAVLTVAGFFAVLAKPEASAASLGDWLAESSAPGDTAVVLYGHANVLERSGLGTPYPYLWSLPIRTRDPELADLRVTLSGRDAPAWVVAWDALNSWDIDRSGQLAFALNAGYRDVVAICGHTLYLRQDLTRDLADVPDDCGEL